MPLTENDADLIVANFYDIRFRHVIACAGRAGIL